MATTGANSHHGLTRSNDPWPPVRESLAAAATEVERVGFAAENLQAALSPLLHRGGEAVEAVQALDEITQRLHGLSQFLSAIAQECSADWRLDVSQAGARLRLHSQKLHLIQGAAPLAARMPLT